jgi:hypothetical protein
MPVTEAEIVDLLAGVTRVHLAIIRGLSENHPRSAENIIWRVREEANLTEPDGTPTLNGLPARLLLGMLEAKPPNTEPAPEKEAPGNPLQALLKRTLARLGA